MESVRKDVLSSGMKSGDLLDNLRVPIFIGLLGLSVLVVALMLVVFLPCLKQKIMAAILKQRDAWMFNNLIGAITLTYLT